MRTLILALMLSASLCTSALAFQETWVSEGGASAVIIGSLTVNLQGNAGSITFQNGKTMGLRKVAEEDGRILFEVVPPQDPILKYGNRLCGMDTPVTRVLLDIGQPMGRYLTVWSGEQHCAMYPMYEKNAYDRIGQE